MCSDKSSYLTSICVTEVSALNTAEVENIECNVNIIKCDLHSITTKHLHFHLDSEYRVMQFIDRILMFIYIFLMYVNINMFHCSTQYNTSLDADKNWLIFKTK